MNNSKYLPLEKLKVASRSQLILAYLLLLVGGCDSNGSDANGDTNTGDLGTMEARVDGAQWKAVIPLAVSAGSGAFKQLSVSGASTDIIAISFALAGDITTGSYSLGDGVLAVLPNDRAGGSSHA